MPINPFSMRFFKCNYEGRREREGPPKRWKCISFNPKKGKG
jgi:hypothetical protein